MHYRLEKRLSLWWVKKNKVLVILYFTDFKVVMLLTTHLIHYLPLPSYDKMYKGIVFVSKNSLKTISTSP